MGEVERVVEDAEGTARAALSARLDTLREGSGRTYASLARRIGVSGSTLHRYCTGRTVPAEFAPVERLARLCGASAADREALHRLWLLADRERVDRQGPGAPADAVACGPVPDERAGGEGAAGADGARAAGGGPGGSARGAPRPGAVPFHPPPAPPRSRRSRG
ncbi:helix-turn-helix domain-containing protein, partial [Streptomyces sp. AS13]|uniref:helix-turn-helix domain-containing protein n=1 Tax=Streptomyces sp. AS13 TaxID=3038080 RepID=UPI003556291C